MCLQVGTVVKLYLSYPNSRAGYTVKFSDGDQQQYVHANLRLAPGRPISHIGGPVPRALSVGDRVMILASVDQCRRNTAAAGGWTWLAKEAARCGQVLGVVFFCFVVLHFMMQTDCVCVCVCVCPYVHGYHFLP